MPPDATTDTTDKAVQPKDQVSDGSNNAHKETTDTQSNKDVAQKESDRVKSTTDVHALDVHKEDGSVVTYDKGHVTKVVDANHHTRTFEYNADGKLVGGVDAHGSHWASKDGKHWENDKGAKWEGTVKVDKEGNTTLTGKTFTVTEGTDGSVKFVRNHPENHQATDAQQKGDNTQPKTDGDVHKQDGSTVTYEHGHVTKVVDANHHTHTFEYNADGKLSGGVDARGNHWTSKDGKHWENDKGAKWDGTVSVDKEGNTTLTGERGTLIRGTDGSVKIIPRHHENQQVADNGQRPADTTQQRRVANTQQKPGDTTHQKPSDTTQHRSADTTHHTEHKPGDTTHHTQHKAADTTQHKAADNTQQKSDSQAEQKKPDDKPVEKPPEKPVDRQQMEASAEAIRKATGNDNWVARWADKDAINKQLEGKSEAERKVLNDVYKEKYGKSLEDEMSFLSGSDKDKFLSLLHKKDDDKASLQADRIHEKLTENSEFHTPATHKEIQADVIRTLSTCNSKDIEQMDKYYQERYGTTMKGALVQDGNLSDSTKEKAAILCKGADKITDDDRLKLADIAIKDKDINAFKESMQNASPEARKKFMDNGGEQKMKDAFEGHWYNMAKYLDPASYMTGEARNVTDADLTHAEDFAKHGHETLATTINDNNGVFHTSRDNIDHAIDRMSDEDRKNYNIGKQLAEGQTPADKLSDDQKKTAQDYYKETHDAMVKAGNTSDVAKWENEIATKDGLVAKVASHRGHIWNDSSNDMLKDVEGMTKDQWQYCKQHPEQRAELENALQTLKGTRIEQSDIDKAMKMYDEKMAATSYDDAKQVGGRSIFDSMDADTHWYGNNRGAIVDDISHMTKEQQEAYRNNTDGFRDKLDEKLKDAVKDGPALEASQHLLNKIMKGEAPEPDLISKLGVIAQERQEAGAKYRIGEAVLTAPAGGIGGLLDSSKAANEKGEALFGSHADEVVKAMQEEFQKDPTLRDRINNPKTFEDQQMAQEFKNSIHGALSDADYEKYAKPLLETGHLDLATQMDGSKSFFSDDKHQMLDDLSKASPEEKQRLLSDKDAQEKMLSHFNEDDRQVALNVLQQKDGTHPADELRYRLNHWGGSSDIMSTIDEMKSHPGEWEKAKEEYAHKYGSDLESDLLNKLGGDDKSKFLDMVHSSGTAAEQFDNAQDNYERTRSGFGNWFSDNVANSATGNATDDALLHYQKEMVSASAQFKDLTPEQSKQLSDNFNTALQDLKDSKSAAADAVVNGTIAAAAIGSLIVTGGADAPLLVGMAVGGGLFKVGAKYAIEGNDYDMSLGQVSKDLGTGAIDGFTAVLGPGEVAAIFKVGETAGLEAAQVTLKELGEQGVKSMLKEGGEEALQNGTKELMRESLASGAKKIDEKAIQELANNMVKPVGEGFTQEMREKAVQQLSLSLKNNITESFKKETANYLTNMAREGLLNSGGGAMGGGAAGFTGAAVEWDPSKSVEENMSRIAQATALSAGSGAVMAGGMGLGMKGLAKGYEGLKGLGGEVPRVPAAEIHGETPNVEVKADTPAVPQQQRVAAETPVEKPQVQPQQQHVETPVEKPQVQPQQQHVETPVQKPQVVDANKTQPGIEIQKTQPLEAPKPQVKPKEADFDVRPGDRHGALEWAKQKVGLGEKPPQNPYIPPDTAPREGLTIQGKSVDAHKEPVVLGPEGQARISGSKATDGQASMRLDEKGNVYIKDLNSTEGTFVNGKRIDAESGEVKLKPGDKVTIGSHEVAWGKQLESSYRVKVGGNDVNLKAGQEVPLTSKALGGGDYGRMGMDERGIYVIAGKNAPPGEGVNLNGKLIPAGEKQYLKPSDDLVLGSLKKLHGVERQESVVLLAKDAPLIARGEEFHSDPAAFRKAVQQSNDYAHNHEITDKLEDGWANAGQHREFGKQGEMLQQQLFRPATVVDRENDPVLRAVIAEAKEKFGNLPEKERAIALNEYVNKLLKPEGMSEASLDKWYDNFNMEHGGERVYLGQFIREGKGVCSQQATLMKVLGDELGLKVTLVRGTGDPMAPAALNHAWTHVDLPGEKSPLIFDPRWQVAGEKYGDVPAHIRGADVEAVRLKKASPVVLDTPRPPTDVVINGKPLEIPQNGDPVTIGRGHAGTVDATDPNYSKVSANHAQLARGADGRLYIKDTSSNGTWVNGERIPKDRPFPLGPNDVVRLGSENGPELKLGLQPKPPADVAINGKPFEIKTGEEVPIGRKYGMLDRNDPNISLVSADHASLRRDADGNLFIKDTSRNGTWVNGERIPRDQEWPIGPHDQVHLGAADGPELTLKDRVLLKGEVAKSEVILATPEKPIATGPDGKVRELLYPSGQRQSFEYGDDGKLDKVTYQNGAVAERVEGKNWKITNASGKGTYDWQGDMAVTKDGTVWQRPLGGDSTGDKLNGTRVVYDRFGGTRVQTPDGHVINTTDTQGRITNYSYGHNGELNQITFPNGQRATSTDGKTWLINDTSHPNGSYEWHGQASVDNNGALHWKPDGGGETTIRADGTKTVLQRAGGGHTESGDGKILDVSDGKRLTRFEYNPEGQLKKVTMDGGRSAESVDGKSWTVTDPNRPEGNYTWRGSVNVEKDGSMVWKAEGGSQTTVRSDGTRIVKETDGGSRTLSPEGRVTSTRDANGSALHYQYSPDGQLSSITYPNGITAEAVLKPGEGQAKQWVIKDASHPDGSYTWDGTFKLEKDGSLWQRATGGDLVGMKLDGTQEINDRFGGTVHLDKSGNVASTTDAKGLTRTFEYAADGSGLRRVSSSDGSESSSNDGLHWTTRYQNGPSTDWVGKMSVDADGTLSAQAEGGPEFIAKSDGTAALKGDNAAAEATDDLERSAPPGDSKRPPRDSRPPMPENYQLPPLRQIDNRGFDPPAIETRIPGHPWSNFRAELPEPGVVDVTDLWASDLPKGAGPKLLAESLKEFNALPTKQLKITSILEPETNAAFLAGEKPEDSVFGHVAAKALKEMGITAKSYRWAEIDGKLAIVIDTQ